MIEKISWEKFRECGALWFVNTVLHLFGLAIVVDIEDDGTISDAYPAECKFRGFDEDTNDKGYRNLTEYIVENKDRLLKDTEAPSESGGEECDCGLVKRVESSRDLFKHYQNGLPTNCPDCGKPIKEV